MWIVLQIAGSKSFTQGRNAFLAPQPVCAGGALLCSTALSFIIIFKFSPPTAAQSPWLQNKQKINISPNLSNRLFKFVLLLLRSIIIYSSFTREFPTGVSAFLQGTLGMI